jgi:hypothetical protein
MEYGVLDSTPYSEYRSLSKIFIFRHSTRVAPYALRLPILTTDDLGTNNSNHAEVEATDPLSVRWRLMLGKERKG